MIELFVQCINFLIIIKSKQIKISNIKEYQVKDAFLYLIQIVFWEVYVK